MVEIKKLNQANATVLPQDTQRNPANGLERLPQLPNRKPHASPSKSLPAVGSFH